jgi:NAD dependent epimerase/dehydratase family enzyme
VANAEFTEVLAKVLRRPAIFPMPAFAARVVFGEMADELLLASQRVEPSKLIASGYKFRHPDLEQALRHILRR